MIHFYVTILFYTAVGSSSKIDVPCVDGMKFIQKPSDSATYYCVSADYTDTALLHCTVLVLKGSSSSFSAVLQPPVSDPVELGGDTTLQCSILTDASAGDHSVYWFRHGSGESHPGIIYTHGNRSDECEKSSETDSPTQSCVYKLPKRNLSPSDAGTYYCAVLMCGEIIFGSGTKLDFAGNRILDPAILGLVTSNIIFMVVVLFLCTKLHNSYKGAADGHIVRVNQAEDTDVLNYAALSFAQSSSSRRSRTKNSSDQPVYAQPPVSDPVELGGNTTLQCSILTDASVGDHSVYWFRHGSGESHPGIIYTHGNRSDECEKSSETDSPTQSCVYKLPKRNLSLSDAGTYYCAVLMCGEIIFGNGTKLDFVENTVLDPTLLILAVSNIISVALVLFLCIKFHYSLNKETAESHTVQANQAEDTDVLNYAALSFAQSSSSRRSRTKNSSDQPVYAQGKTQQ
ncbi:hypothetical protein AOLI_G00111320 [Acnodon oligacanthus]